MTTLHVEEMSCNHCVQRIGALLDELGMKHTIDLAKKEVCIDAQEEQVEKAIDELDDIGFTATRK